MSAREELIKTLKNPGPSSEYVVEVRTDELTFVGKRSDDGRDQRDIAELVVSYSPIEQILELKSFKDYVGSFANSLFSYERVCNTIFDELKEALGPAMITVSVACHVRGGASTTVARSWPP